MTGEVIAFVEDELVIQTADGEIAMHLGPEWYWEAKRYQITPLSTPIMEPGTEHFHANEASRKITQFLESKYEDLHIRSVEKKRKREKGGGKGKRGQKKGTRKRGKREREKG